MLWSFGDLSIGKLWLSEFQGAKKAIPVVLPKLAYDAVPSRDVPIAILRRKLAKAYNANDKKSLKEKLRRALLNRSFLKKKVDEIILEAMDVSCAHPTVVGIA
ncbi:hypothetical protein MTO96_022863 [Rhipicephalus appendiculatus]